MGVYAVRNTVENKVLLGASPNVAGRLNRERFSLENGSHFNRTLVADWNRLGPDAFVFEVLDTLEPSEDPDADSAEDLDALLLMWIDRLGLHPEDIYAHR
jgi:hypothetical protein